MSVAVLHVCDKFGVRGSSIHGVSRLFSWWFARYDRARFDVSLCGLKHPEPATRWLEERGVPVHHLGRSRFDPRIATDVAALARRRGARILHVHGYASADFGRLAARLAGARLVLHEHFADPRMPAYQGLADRLLAPWTDGAIAVSSRAWSTVGGQCGRRQAPQTETEVRRASIGWVWLGSSWSAHITGSGTSAGTSRAVLRHSPVQRSSATAPYVPFSTSWPMG